MKKILVPVDFSDISKQAALFAIDAAKKSGGDAVLLHCIDFDYYNQFPHEPGMDLQSMINQVKQSVEKKMQAFIDDLNTDLTIEPKISDLHLLKSVKEIVKDDNVDLVILGTEGSSGWSEVFVGSNTEKIVRWIDCPVISVPGKASFDSIKKILVPIDLKEIQEGFMKGLSQLQEFFSASLEFLWVKTPHNIENNKQVIEEFKTMAKSHGFEGSSFTVSNYVFPTDGILEQADEVGADMIAMATHARRGISHWLSGSITEDTANRIKIPVWTFTLDKDAQILELQSFKKAEGTPEYKKIQI